MKVIGVLNQKGGVGKTTISTCLAVAFQQSGRNTVIIDLDPQATACFWHDVRENKSPAVISVQPVRLKSMLSAAKENGTDIVIIDGAAIQREISYDVSAIADYVIIPTKPAVFDITSMQETIKALRQNSVPFGVVLNMVSPRGAEVRDTLQLKNIVGDNACHITLGQRKDFFRAQNQGLAVQEYNPSGKAAKEIEKLYRYTCIEIYGDGK